jgi:hypothetical protein
MLSKRTRSGAPSNEPQRSADRQIETTSSAARTRSDGANMNWLFSFPNVPATSTPLRRTTSRKRELLASALRRAPGERRVVRAYAGDVRAFKRRKFM